MHLPREFEKDGRASSSATDQPRRKSIWRIFLPSDSSDVSDLGDNELVARLKIGELDALSILIERYCGVVFRRARNILGDDGEAEDIVGRVFSEVHRSITLFDENKGSFAAWLLLRTLHRSMSRKEYLERRQVHNWVGLPEELPAEFLAGAGTLIRMSRMELRLVVEEALTQLSPSQRTAVYLVHFDGRTAEEASKITGETVASIRYSLHEGIRKLRAVLAADGRIQGAQAKDPKRRPSKGGRL